jgi:hypothetical protein
VAARAKVYLETTVVSYLVARPSRDLRVAAHQQATSEWWTRRRHDFELYVSQLVVEEAGAGDQEMAVQRLRQIEDIDLLDLTESSFTLAQKLLSDGAVPAAAETPCTSRWPPCTEWTTS